MQIEVDMTYKQYFEATRLMLLNTTAKRRWNYWCLWYVYPVLGTVFAFLTVFMWIIDDRRITGTVLFNLLAAFFFFWCRFSFPSRARKLYEQQATNLQGTMTLTPAGLRYERKNGTASTDYTWNGFENWIERPEMFLVFPNNLSFIRIPKDTMTSTEIDDVRGWFPVLAKQS
jgi:hypothetical protein